MCSRGGGADAFYLIGLLLTLPVGLLEMQIPGAHPNGPQVTAALPEIWYALEG